MPSLAQVLGVGQGGVEMCQRSGRVDAIGSGRRAARSIHQYMTGEEIKGSPKSLLKRHIQESLFKSVPGVNKSKRTPMPELEVAERIDSMIEVDQVITEADAKHESGRCLNCCRVCYDPDEPVLIQESMDGQNAA